MQNKLKFSIGIILSVLLWEAAAALLHEDQSLFPSLALIGARFLELVSDADFIHNVRASLGRLAIGTLIGTIMAALTAAVCAIKPAVREVFAAPLYFVFPIPKVALFPFFLLVFGLGWKSQVALMAVGVYFLVYINLQAGVQRLLNSNLRDVLIAQGVSAWRSFYPYFVKGTVPDLLTGLRSGIGYGLTLMVVSEMSGSRDGLGHFMWRAWDLFKIVDLYCGVFVIGVIGVAINLLIDVLHQKILPRYSLTG